MIGRAVFSLFCLVLWATGTSAQIGPSGGGGGGVTGSFTAGDLLVANSSGQVADSSTVNPAVLPTKLEINVGTFTPSSTLPTPSALGLYITEAVTGTCSASSNCYYNYLLIGSDHAVVGSGSSGVFNNGVGWYFNHNFGSAAATGDRVTLTTNLLINGTTGNTAAGASYGSFAAYATANVNDNGTGTGAATSRGQLETINVIASLNNGATNWNSLQAAEFDVRVQAGASLYSKVGIAITQTNDDAVSGSTYDAAIGMANMTGNASGWTNGILFGGLQGVWPFKSIATVITCANCGTIDAFVDMSAATITTAFLKGPGYTVSGTGLVTGLAFVPTSATVPTNGMYLASANVVGISGNSTGFAFVSSAALTLGANGVANSSDLLSLRANTTGVSGATIRNSNTGTATQAVLYMANNTSTTQASLILNGGNFSGGLGANALALTNGGNTGLAINTSGGLQVGSSTLLTLAQGEVGLPKITASGSAPGASGLKFEAVCGTNAGSAKIITYAGTSTTPVTVVDNVGSGVTGC